MRRNAAILERNRQDAFHRKLDAITRLDSAPPVLDIMPLLPIRAGEPVRSMFQVTEKDIVFALYRMKLTSLDQLRRSLEKIGFEEAARRSAVATNHFRRALRPSDRTAVKHLVGRRLKRTS